MPWDQRAWPTFWRLWTDRRTDQTLCDDVYCTCVSTCKLPLLDCTSSWTEAEKIPIHATEMGHLNWAVYTALYLQGVILQGVILHCIAGGLTAEGCYTALTVCSGVSGWDGGIWSSNRCSSGWTEDQPRNEAIHTAMVAIFMLFTAPNGGQVMVVTTSCHGAGIDTNDGGHDGKAHIIWNWIKWQRSVLGDAVASENWNGLSLYLIVVDDDGVDCDVLVDFWEFMKSIMGL